VKNFVCNKSTTVSTFSEVFRSTSSAGASIGGTFSASGTQNAGNTVGTCP
jgi:hypothetical protein